MTDPNVPTFGYILDALTVRIECPEVPDDERAALKAAREVLENHALGDIRNRSLIAVIRSRIARRFAA